MPERCHCESRESSFFAFVFSLLHSTVDDFNNCSSRSPQQQRDLATRRPVVPGHTGRVAVYKMSIGLFVLVLVIQRCCCCWGSGNLDAPSSHQLLEEEHTCEPVGRAGGLSCEAEAEAAESDSSFYAASLALTRSRVQLRDTDVVIATYPKSGTHWVVAATSFLLSNQTRAPLATALNKHHQRYGDDPEHIVRFFHHYPVFMLLPDSRREPVPNSTFELVESIPDGVPRIFVVCVEFSVSGDVMNSFASIIAAELWRLCRSDVLSDSPISKRTRVPLGSANEGVVPFPRASSSLALYF